MRFGWEAGYLPKPNGKRQQEGSTATFTHGATTGGIDQAITVIKIVHQVTAMLWGTTAMQRQRQSARTRWVRVLLERTIWSVTSGNGSILATDSYPYEMDDGREIIDTLCDTSTKQGCKVIRGGAYDFAPSDMRGSNREAREPQPFPTLG